MRPQERVPTVILARRYGQLGNRLHLVSHFIAHAEESKLHVYNFAFLEYAHFFAGTQTNLLLKYPCATSTIANRFTRGILYFLLRRMMPILFLLAKFDRGLAFVDLQKFQSLALESEPFRLVTTGNRVTLIEGWTVLSSTRPKHRDKIRAYFSLVKPYSDNVEALMAKIRPDFDTIIGIHIRRGDYRIWRNGAHYYSYGQYRDFAQAVSELFPRERICFLLCADGPIPKDMLDAINRPCFLGTGVAIEDMYAFAQCDYLVGPPSTFTLWASFIGEVPLYHVYDPGATMDLASFELDIHWS